MLSAERLAISYRVAALRAIRAAGWLALALLSATPVFFCFSSSTSLAAAACVAGLGVMAVWNTADAVLLLAAFAPIASTVQQMTGAPRDGYVFLEVCTLAVLAGAALRAAGRGSRFLATSFDAAILAFIAVVVTSWLAQLPVELLRAEVTGPVASIVDTLARTYFDRSIGFFWQTTLLVEGAALAALVARTFRVSGLAVRLRDMVVAGGAAAAALNVNRLLEIAFRSGSFLETLKRDLQALRFNTQYGDLNAAGSYFALIAVLCCAQAGFRSARQWLHSGLLILIGCALWVSGSRVALGAAFLCGTAVIAIRNAGVVRVFGGSRLRVALSALLLTAALAGTALLWPASRHSSFEYAASTRVGMLQAGARMVRDRPLLGVGISRFYTLFPRYASPQLLQEFQKETGRPILNENAHNQFMQFAAELGLVGVTSFGWLLVLALRPSAVEGPTWRIGVLAAVGAFLLTCLAGHPLLTPLVACPFWIVLGLAASGAPPPQASRAAFFSRGVAGLLVLLLLLVPVRWRYERREADLRDVTIGLSRWERDAQGIRFRWADKRSTLFVASGAVAVRLRVRSPDGSARQVNILLDGQPAGHIVVAPGRWTETNLFFSRPRRPPAFRRLDLEVASDPRAAGGDTRSLLVGQVEEVWH